MQKRSKDSLFVPRRQLTFWTAIRVRSRVMVVTAVFCLFATVGLMALQMSPRRTSIEEIVLRAALSGGFAVGYFVALIARKAGYFTLLIALQVAVEWALVKYSHASETLAGSALQRQLMILGFCEIAGIVAAYSLMIHFFTAEGKRYFEIRTEMALAAEIHRALVPAYPGSIDGFEIYGASVPSGEVGGDLVDVVELPQGWLGYVADVSGHGVQSGVLMAMFKTALRAQIAERKSLGCMLTEVHRTLFPLKLENMFVTAGVLQSGGNGRVVFASAGHPPILQYHKKTGEVSEHGALDPPLGIAKEQEFSELTIQCEAGDVLLVLTDGLTEVFDTRGNEIGTEALKTSFVAHIDLSLEELFKELRKVATQFGAQTDDQTVLLARYRGWDVG
jgi:serine phosphatase RsbU (regulator of sigma subunit)